MKLKKEFPLDQLIKAIEQLPTQQLLKLKGEINNAVPEKTEIDEFKKFLLQAPQFTDDQIMLMEDARKSINKLGIS